MKRTNILIAARALLLSAFLTLGFAACDDEGPAERAGERLDNATDDAADAIEDTADDISDSAEEGYNDMRRAAEDAAEEID